MYELITGRMGTLTKSSEIVMTLTTSRRGAPKVSFEQIALNKPFEYFDTLYVKCSEYSAVALVPGNIEVIDPHAQVFPVTQIEYKVAD